MATASIALADLGGDDRFVLCRCRDCPRRFGRYAFWRLLLDPADPSWLPVLTEDHVRRLSWAARPGTGLAAESYAGRFYVRLRCKCGRNQKFSLSTVRDFRVVMERGERIAYL
jgi:hypothetical protein